MEIKKYLPLFYFILLLFITATAWKYLIGPKLILLETQEGITSAEIKYDLFTNLINFFLTLMAISIIPIYLWIKRDVEVSVNKKTEKEKIRLESLMRCTQMLQTCVQQEKRYEDRGEIKMALMQKSKKTSTIVPVWLEELISKARSALNYAEMLKGTKDEKIILHAKNNLAYYLTIARIRENEARMLIKEVYQKAGEYNNYNWIETYLWVCWCFAKDENEKKEARKIFYELYKQKDIITKRELKSKLEEYKQFFDQVFTTPIDHQKQL
ncbi:MAG: hypothetical protein HQ539_00345 [Parcubacteria group bacterium]|nr:hypothetical protein [Parcubacteria group bacterium]